MAWQCGNAVQQQNEKQQQPNTTQRKENQKVIRCMNAIKVGLCVFCAKSAVYLFTLAIGI